MRTTSTLAARAATAGAIAGAGVLALIYPLTARVLHPYALPALIVAAVLASISLRRIEVGVAVALLLTAFSPPFLGGSAWLPGLLWSLMLVGVVALRQGRAEATRRLPPLSALVLVNLVVVLIAFARAPAGGDAISVLRSTVTGTVLFFVIATQIRSRREISWTIHGFLGGALLVGATATVQWVTGSGREIGFLTNTGELVYRVSGGLGHPNQLGGFLVVLVPLAIAVAITSRRTRIFALVVTVVAVLGIYASFSRGALVALAVCCVLLLRARTIVLLLPVLAVFGISLAPQTLQERFETATTSGSELATRTDIWTTAIAVWEEEPVLGAGLGSFPIAYAESRTPGKDFLPNTRFEPPPHAHNVYLHVLAEQGLLGLLAFFGVFLATALHARRLRGSPPATASTTSWYGRAMLASMAAFAVHNVLDVTLLEQTGIYIWALIGLVSALVASERADEQRDESTPLATAAAL